MFVLELEDSVVINRPVEEVFAYMDDIEKEHEWQPYLKEWEQSPDPRRNGVGTIRRYENHYLGRSFTNVYVITEYEPNKRVMYRSTPEAAVQAKGGQMWEVVKEGTKVTFVFEPELGDFWGYIPKFIVRRIYMRTLTSNMARLKKV